MTFDADKTQLPGDSSGSSSLSAGQEFGQYKVIRQLGRGGMGEVYEVEHAKLGSRHAVKLINQEIVERATVGQRFEREAKVMARLKHPNIVHVDDFGETEGRTWLRMELIGNLKPEGGDLKPEVNSLADLLAGEPLPEALVVDLLQQILGGLSYAHERGVVHRDLKPANILIAPNPLKPKNLIPKITDFGLVRLAGEQWLQSQVQLTVAQSIADPDATRLDSNDSDSSAGTSTQAMLGTFEFMAPEQKKGQEADALSDLYAIGLIAFRMLTGEDSPGFEMPSQLVPGLSPDWDAWVIKSLKRQADARFESAEAMLAAMPISGDVKEQNIKALTSLTANRQAATNRKPVLLFALLVMLLAGGASAYYLGVYVPEQARQAELVRVQLAKKQAAELARIELEKKLAADQARAEAERQRIELEIEQAEFAAEAKRIADARGSIFIESEPADAKVTIGSFIKDQQAPITLKDVKLGEYAVTVTADGYEDWTGRLTIEENQLASPGLVKLVRKVGNVSITSLPNGADIYIEGRKLGETPLNLENIPDGSDVSYELRMKGYQNTFVSGVVTFNETLNLDTNLLEFAGPVLGKDWALELAGGESVKMKWIRPETFMMGSDEGAGFEKPAHQVTLSQGYHLGKTEVTIGQWRKFVEATGYKTEAEVGDGVYHVEDGVLMRTPDSSWRSVFSENETNPVVGVSWNDAMRFCKWVTDRERAAGRLIAGYEYSLPTEAQWEYACRAGTTGPFAGDVDAMAWHFLNSGKKTNPVASKRPNSFGLYDMHGNVAEWCNDFIGVYPSRGVTDPIGPAAGLSKVVRGGSWRLLKSYSASHSRVDLEMHMRFPEIGFRLAHRAIKGSESEISVGSQTIPDRETQIQQGIAELNSILNFN